MKRVIKADSSSEDTKLYVEARRHADWILLKMKDLFDAMDSTPAGFLDANDLGQLYLDLSDSIRDLSYAIDDDLLAYKRDKYGRISKN